MNDLKLRAFVRQLIAEAKAKKTEKKDDKKPAKKADKKDDKKEPKTVKSSGKLMDLKKEIAYLKEMSAQIQATGLTEAEEVTEVEFANLQKFVSELAKVKEASAALKAKLDEEITTTEAKIKAEKDKIKEMIGLVSETEELDEARFKKGEDVGKPGKGFAKIAKSAAKKYGSKKAGQKVAGAILKKVVAKENIHNTAQMGGILGGRNYSKEAEEDKAALKDIKTAIANGVSMKDAIEQTGKKYQLRSDYLQRMYDKNK